MKAGDDKPMEGGGVNVKTSSTGAEYVCLLETGASCDEMQTNKTTCVFV